MKCIYDYESLVLIYNTCYTCVLLSPMVFNSIFFLSTIIFSMRNRNKSVENKTLKHYMKVHNNLKAV